MNYLKHYDTLVSRAKDRNLICYTEKHRIIPGCMGGRYTIDNVVRLTPEEHFVAHILLIKIYPKNKNLVYAANQMSFGSKNNPGRRNKRYGWLRKKFSSSQTGVKRSQETRDKISNALIGIKRSEETKKN